MFNINKPAFGTPSNNTSSFFTSTPSNRFGDNFTKPNTPNFGEFNKTVAPNFGNTSFNSNTSAFVPNPFGQSYFGNVFNNSSLPQQNDFFGNQFNQNEKSAFNFTAKPSAFVFGQNNPQTNVFKQQSATGMFPSSSFGPPASSTIPPGTVIKFVPVKLTDTSIIKGINQTINGKNQCITCMKEYEDKSLEELRWEDYQANRKGPQDNFFFTNTTTEPMTMEAPTTLNMFSQENNLNKNLFGFKFGAAPVPTSSNPPTGLFGKSVFGFGNTNTAQSTPNYFGTTNTSTVTNNFQTQQQPSQTTNSNIFNRNTPFSNNPTINNLQQQSSLFPGLNTNTTFSFGNSPTVTSTAVIGQSTFGQNIFNSSPIKPPTQQSVFNTSFKSAFPGLSNHASAPLNTNTNNNIFKFNPTIPQQCTFNSQQQLPPQQQYLPQAPQPQNQLNFSVINPTPNHEQILAMSSTPYGLSDLLNNIKEIDNSIKDSTRATNPNELKTLLKTVKPETKIIHDKLQPIHIFRKADQSMFDDLDIEETLVQQKNPKKLILKNYPFLNDSKEEYFGGIFENMTNTNTSTIQNEEVTVEAATQVEELEETINEIKNVINPTGIILTRPEYYTVPPLEELIDYINEEDGSCIVQGFTIGRLGYGNVYFPDAFDVSNLNLDELVHFCYKEVTIYPDDSKKPPQGEGLNRKAQITLDKVWPYDKKTNMLITDIDALTEMDYADRLRRLCDRQQTKFVDYRPDTGSWVFRVDHFSKYGDEDDDDDDDCITEHTTNLLINNDLIINELENNENLVNYLSDDFSKCTLMKSTFFNDVSDAESVSSTNKFDYFDETSTLLLDIFAEDNDQNQFEDVVDNVGLPFRIPLEKSYFKYFKIYCDTAGFKGRSFKIGWSRQTQFLTLAHQNNILENSIQINKIETCSGSLILNQCLEDHLNIQLNNSQYDFTDAQSIPNLSSIPGFKLLEDQQNNCSGVDLKNDVWKLCGALFGQIRENDLWDARSIRKTLLTNWLQGVLQKDVVFSPDDASNDTIMKYLCLYKIKDAAHFAFQQDNINLSMLMSQLPSNLPTRSFLMKQLYVWRDMPQLIDCDLLKIYLLVCGLPKIEFDNNQTISVCEDMSWLQVLAIYLWYVIRPEEPIANGINLYDHSFSNNSDVAKPIRDDENLGCFDLRYQLLKYYSDNKYPLEKVLNPLAHTTNLLDFRFSWLLLEMLESLGQCDIDPKMKQSVHLNFAVQLEELKLWHWAVFVLLFIEDVRLKTELIKEVIGRNVQVAHNSKEYTKREHFLINTLKIPAHWLEVAKATLARRLGKTRDAICYLCYAEQWAEAYSLLMDMLLPNAFFGYDYDFLCKILAPLALHKHTLPNWEERGGLILNFARLGIEYNSSDSESDRFKNQSMRFRASVVNVHARFRDISDLSYIRHVAGRNWWSLFDHLLN